MLRRLAALPAAERLACLRGHGPPVPTLNALADRCERSILSRVTEALPASEALVAAADELGEPQPRIRTRRTRAQALAYAGRFADALAMCDEAIALGADGRHPVDLARVRLTSMHPLGELGRYDEALAAGAAAREVFQSAGEHTLAAYADVNLGIIQQNRDRPAEALAHFDRARQGLRREPVRLGWLESNRGEALLQLHDFDGAEAAFRASLEASEACDATLAAAIAEGNLADLAARRGRLHDAMFHFERARRRLERDAAESHLARLLAEQADAIESLGLTDDAIAAYQSALPRLERQGMRAEAARARQGLGRVLLRRSRLVEAAPLLDEAAEEFARLGNPVARAKVDLIRAELHLARREPDIARDILRDAAPALADRPADQAILHYTLARVAMALGDRADALRQLESALPVATELDLPPLLADLLHCRARLHRAAGRAREAVADLRAALEQVERVRGMLQAERLRYAFLGDRASLFADLVIGLLTPPANVAEAFAVVERARSRALLDAVCGAVDALPAPAADVCEDAERELHTTAARLRGELNILYSKVFEGTGRPGAAGWREALKRRETELREVERRIDSARDAAGGLLARPATLARIQPALAPDQVLIEYFDAAGEVLAFTVSREEARVQHGLATVDQIERQADRVGFQLARAARPGALEGPAGGAMLEDARRELHALWKLVLAPLEGFVSKYSRCVFVPHGALHRAPLHALWDGNRYLLERMEVTYAPSASLLALLAERAGIAQPVAAGRALVVGVGDQIAPQITAEAAAVAATLPGATLLTGPDATADAVLRFAAQADVIHLACHGWYSSEHPLSSGLKMSDRWLTVRDVYAARIPATLVVLSGCDTGRSRVLAGDELLGFLRGFFVAGAGALIVSQWVLNDNTAAEAMTAFYRTRFAADRPTSAAAALRSVQLAAMQRRPHPTFWAPLILVGSA